MTAGSRVSSYLQNGAGELVRSQVTVSGTPSDPTYSVYDEQHHLIGRYGAAAPSTSSHEFVYLGDMPIAVFAPGSSTPWNVFSDHLGTPVSVAPTNGPARWKWENKGPFGEYLPDENPSGAGAYAFPLRFPGQQYDAESQLHYNYFRDYDPVTGRYLQADPIGLKGGANPYAYVRGNPLAYVDPLGLLDRLYFDGNRLYGMDDFGIEFWVPAVSGARGRMRLPEGVYGGRKLRERANPAMKCPGQQGWSVDLDPTFETNRTDLRIHPDGNLPGTLGCIAPTCEYAPSVLEKLKEYFSSGRDIPVIVQYPREFPQ
jgi:RHS repeat-associated protein